jgi:GDP-4-dehydro-6-deoxy-D-mannose reductase
MVKIWVTGAGGFMGVHLVEMMLNQGHEVLASYSSPTTPIKDLNSKARIEECDIRDKEKVFRLMEEFMPDKIFHLAAQSYPSVSWDKPNFTIEVNIIGSINIFEAVKKFKPDCKILSACSSAEYGLVTQEEVPVKESHELKPLHPYGVSKAAQEMLGYQYFKNFNLKPVSIRIFNTTGPRKVNDVCADFTKRLIEIEKGINPEKKLRVGNLETRRAITDVRDVLRAFDLILDLGDSGEAYNLSGDRVYSIREIVEILKNLVDFDFEIWQDPELMRPSDEPIIYGDSSKLKLKTGWVQEVALEKTLKDMLDYWRSVL